jgi:hypothetical protein
MHQLIAFNARHLSYVLNTAKWLKLVHLLFVSPALSEETERSFCALRRLNIWPRSTVIEKRLNSQSVRHLQQAEVLDLVDVGALIEEFISRYYSDTRACLYILRNE